MTASFKVIRVGMELSLFPGVDVFSSTEYAWPLISRCSTRLLLGELSLTKGAWQSVR